MAGIFKLSLIKLYMPRVIDCFFVLGKQRGSYHSKMVAMVHDTSKVKGTKEENSWGILSSFWRALLNNFTLTVKWQRGYFQGGKGGVLEISLGGEVRPGPSNPDPFY